MAWIRLLTVFIAILLVLSGCTSVTFGPESSTPDESAVIALNNSANVTHMFEVWVVELPANVTVTNSNGNVATGDIGEGLVTSEPGDNRTFTSIELPNSARLHGQYRLEPGAENQSHIDEFPRDFAVVVIVYQNENAIIEWVSANCADASLSSLNVRSRYVKTNADVFASYSCGYNLPSFTL